MAQTHTVTTYAYDELSPKAKERALENWRINGFLYDWWDAVYEDAERIANLFGLEFDDYHVPLMNGSTRREPRIQFTGFWSQGDGACFLGTYRYKKGGLKAVKQEAPLDTELHDIVWQLQTIQRQHFYRLSAYTRVSGNYSHSNAMQVEVENDELVDGYEGLEDAEASITRQLRRFADWIYRNLEAEYEYQTSEENFAALAEANDWQFTEDGELWG